MQQVFDLLSYLSLTLYHDSTILPFQILRWLAQPEPFPAQTVPEGVLKLHGASCYMFWLIMVDLFCFFPR